MYVVLGEGWVKKRREGDGEERQLQVVGIGLVTCTRFDSLNQVPGKIKPKTRQDQQSSLIIIRLQVWM